MRGATCPRCRNAKSFFARLNTTWPALRFQVYEITQDASARARWQELCRQANRVPGLPTTQFAGRIIVGYQGESITGRQFQDLVERVSGSARSAATTPTSRTGAPGLISPLWMTSLLQAPAAQEPDYEDVPLPYDLLLETPRRGLTGRSG